ncbi:aromatic prenyltransferase [Aspergillus stella-maris]|uniref:aromatic prenyltransferase n=1 Tax=Aspergillus stella-maris TaxID=1810926 RepID=UPI003CCD6E97
MSTTSDQAAAGPLALPDAFRNLSEMLRFSNNDHERWWFGTGPMFAVMMSKAHYDIHAQYKFLLLHRVAVIPALGAYPEKGETMHWNSHLTRFGLPFELSFNYSHSLLRFAFEPLGVLTGTAEDPFNTQAIRPVLASLQPLVPNLDLELFNLFTEQLVVTRDETERLTSSDIPLPVFKTQNKLAADMDPSGEITLKTYIYPRIKSLATGIPNAQLMCNAIRAADRGGKLNAPLGVLERFLSERAPTLLGHFLSCDLVESSQSRIKFYCIERQIDLPSIEGIWTLNGSRQDAVTQEGLQALRELWGLLPIAEGLAPLPNCFYKLGTSPQEQLPFIINFTLSPHHDHPQPQIYFPAFGQNDGRIADGLTTFFQRRGLPGMAKTYAEDLAAYYPDIDMHASNHLQAWISFSYKKQSPYMSVYLHTFEALRDAAEQGQKGIFSDVNK